MLLLFILVLVVWSGYLFVTLRYRVVWAGIEVRRDKYPMVYWICVGVNALILAGSISRVHGDHRSRTFKPMTAFHSCH